MYKNNTIKISRTTLITVFVLAATLLFITVFAVSIPASAQEDNSYTYRGLTISGNQEPKEGQDYEISANFQEITIKTNGWILSGNIGVAGDSPELLSVYINCDNIALSGLEAAIDGCDLKNLRPTEISLIGGDDSYFYSLSFDYDVTIKGPKKLHVYSGILNANKNITFINTVVEVWRGQPPATNKDVSAIMTVRDGDLKAYNSRIVIVNDKNGIGLGLEKDIFLDETSEIFIAGKASAIHYIMPGILSNAYGTEEYFAEYKDFAKVNKPIAEKQEETISGELFYSKVVKDSNIEARTLYLGPTMPTPAPEPVIPTPGTTAETGDSANIALLVLTLIAMLSFGVNVTSRKKINK